MKQYVKPTTELVDISTSTLMAGSGLGGTPKTPGMGSSRYRNSLWDEDDDDWLTDDSSI